MNYRKQSNKELNPFRVSEDKRDIKINQVLFDNGVISTAEKIYKKLSLKIKKKLNHNISIKQIVLMIEYDHISVSKILSSINNIGSDVTTATKFRQSLKAS